jgi:hypothetical protein
MKHKSFYFILLFLLPVTVSNSFSQIISFYPEADTIMVVGCCTSPAFICNSPNYSYSPVRIAIEPGWVNQLRYKDNYGTIQYITECYFGIEDDMYEYELWFLPQETAHNDTQLVIFDSSLTIQPTEFKLKLLVKKQGLTIDSSTHALIAIYEPLKIQETENLNIPKLKLLPNYPNPFNPLTRIDYYLPKSEEIEIELYNVNGQKVKLLYSGRQKIGYHSLTLDGGDMPSGIYYYRLKSSDFVDTRKCLLIK